MNLEPVFSEVLIASQRAWNERKVDESILSIAIPVKAVDPLEKLPLIAEKHQFRFLWDLSPELCISAAGHCQYLDLAGSKRFETAQRFSDETFERLIDFAESPDYAAPRILYAFSFFEQSTDNEKSKDEKFSFQAVLPRWQLTSKSGSTWLRLNAVIQNLTDVRESSERLWTLREEILRTPARSYPELKDCFPVDAISNDWRLEYSEALTKGIQLVNAGDLDKLVLATRQLLLLKEPLEPLEMLSRLRDQQTNSCRFLWQKSNEESFFGASPERLISLNNNQLFIDALAGTAKKHDDGKKLLASSKDLREHDFVVKSIVEQLAKKGIKASYWNQPQLIKQDHLIHLHTLVEAYVEDLLPLDLIEALHPTPAVAGLPLQKAMSWLSTLELFDRRTYAAPIGWIDKEQNAEFRVSIRYGHISGNKLELIAGAGLVKGSTVEGELQEVGLKLDVLINQLNLAKVNYLNDLIDSQ